VSHAAFKFFLPADKPWIVLIVLLSRIRVLFAISDINNAAEDDFADVPAEDVEGGDEEEEVAPVSFPVRASVTIEKVIWCFDPEV
jgi:hypothetical protein